MKTLQVPINPTRAKLLTALCLLLFSAAGAWAIYSPQTGRWLSRDPIGEDGGANVTSVSGNDLVQRVDPLGLKCAPCKVLEALQAKITPAREIFPPPASISREGAVWDGDQATLWFTLTAKFANRCCDVRQEARGRLVLDGVKTPSKLGSGQPLDPKAYRDDGYGRGKEPDAYHDQPDGTVVFSAWDSPGSRSGFKTYDISLDFKGYVLDICPDSPHFGQVVGSVKYYGFRASGPAPNVRFTTIYGFDNNSQYWPAQPRSQ